MRKILLVISKAMMASVAVTLVACNPNPTTDPTPTVEATAEATDIPTPTDVPTNVPTVEAPAEPTELPTPTQIAPPPFACAAPTELPSGKLICWPVDFNKLTEEIGLDGQPTGVEFEPREKIQLDMDLTDVDANKCVLHGSHRWVDCRNLRDLSSFEPDGSEWPF